MKVVLIKTQYEAHVNNASSDLMAFAMAACLLVPRGNIRMRWRPKKQPWP